MQQGNTTRFGVLALLLIVTAVSGCVDMVDPVSSGTATNSDENDTNSGNNTPEISGAPKTLVLAGELYTFAPTASDPDGDALTFSIRNPPSWATFDSTTGRLSGQVQLGDVGTYGGIQISVSDAVTTSSLPEYSITVAESAVGSMTLEWAAPTSNTNGTPLTDLAGYNVYFGLSRDNYPNQVRIDDPAISTYVIEDLSPDIYYVVATSFNSLGVESGFSNVATVIVAPDS